jgi:4-amino-4-deoxy-L-arabinose transferase-like glycosyltransferase
MHISPVRRGLLARWLVNPERREIFLLVMILAVAAFLRLYRIPETMTFLGDEGRDAIMVRRMLISGRPVLTGPATSTGDMVLGPLYYYLIAPALLAANYSPVGPAVLVALIGVATVFLVWAAAREWFGAGGPVPAWGPLAAAALYATAPVAIITSRSSWNPNIMPFVALLSVYAAWRAWRREDDKWLIVLAASFAFVLQSHYLGLILAPTTGLAAVLALANVIKTIRPGLGNWQLVRIGRFLCYSAASLLVFLLLFSPLLLYEARQGWNNLKAIQAFITGSQVAGEAAVDLSTALIQGRAAFAELHTLLFPGASGALGIGVALAVLGASLAFMGRLLRQGLRKDENAAYLILLAWIFGGTALLGVYQGALYPHYFAALFPASFLLIGGMLQALQEVAPGRQSLLSGAAVLAITGLLVANLANTPLKSQPNRQLQRAENVARAIAVEAGGKPLNLTVIGKINYEDAYQYFLELWEQQPLDIDRRRLSETIAGQLFVVCELPREACDPALASKLKELKFRRGKVAGQWDLAGVRLYRIVQEK